MSKLEELRRTYRPTEGPKMYSIATDSMVPISQEMADRLTRNERLLGCFIRAQYALLQALDAPDRCSYSPQTLLEEAALRCNFYTEQYRDLTKELWRLR